jgi:hypothetical protein
MMIRIARGVTVLLAALMFGGCQSTTDPDNSVDANDVVDVAFAPDPVGANTSDGRTYRVVRGNNQPDEILQYDWRTTFAVTTTINGQASDADLAFPIKLTSTAVKVQQASGGVVTPPTGGETEHYESVLSNISGSEFASENTSVTMTVEAWYDLPSLKREALVTITFSFEDADGVTFTRNASVRVSP